MATPFRDVNITTQSISKSWKMMPKNCRNKLKQKGSCNKPTKFQFQSILTQKKIDALERYESTEVDRRTWLHVPSGDSLVHQ